MTHNAKSDNIDAILESGNLIAPSFASKLKNIYNIDVIEYDDNIKNALKQVETEQPEIYFQTGINQGEITNIDGSIVKDVSNLLDYDYLNNQVTGEKVSIEINQDIKVEEIKPQNISSDLPFEISQKPSDNKKKLINILNFKEGKNLVNNNTNESAIVNNKTIEKSLSNTIVNNTNYKDFCNIILNIENCL